MSARFALFVLLRHHIRPRARKKRQSHERFLLHLEFRLRPQSTMNTTRKKSRYFSAVLLLISLLSSASAQQPKPQPQTKPFELTVDSIMRGPRLVGYPPTGVYWSQDSQRIYFRWKQPDEPRLKEMSLYVVNRDESGLRRLTEEEAKQAR